MKTARADKRTDKLIEQIYRQHCAGRNIRMTEIPALFTLARQMIAEGATPEAIGAAMVARTEATQ